MVYKVKQGQSIYDLATLYGYGIERVVDFLQAAPQLISLDNTQIGGKEIDVTKIKTNLVVYLNLYATGISNQFQNDNTVFAEEDLQTIFISEDGTTEFTPEI